MKFNPKQESSVPVSKYKLLIINEKQLIEELENQAKLGFDIVEILDKQIPNSSSDVTAYKILLRKK